MVLSVRPVMAEDAPSLTDIHFGAISNDHLTQLLFGDADRTELKRYMADAFEKELRAESPLSSRNRYLVVTDTELNQGQPIAWAHWQWVGEEEESSETRRLAKPAERSGANEVGAEMEGKKGNEVGVEEDRGYPGGLNASLQAAFEEGLAAMRERVLKGKINYYILRNVATHPAHERRGAATMLLRWPFEIADEERVMLYLDTALDGPSLKLYERNGFVMVYQCQLDLESFGGSGVHTHVAMIREPRTDG